MRFRTILCGALMLAMVGCGTQEPEARDAKPKSSDPPKPAVCPLTGTEKPPGTPMDHPALAIKVENSLNARPQAGLESADVVYEELAEGGITRFLAVYHCSEADSVGPVRSARMVDPDILSEYGNVLFGYSGANIDVQRKIQSKGHITDLKHGNHGEAYRRQKGRPAPHDLFTSTHKLRALEDAGGVRGGPSLPLTFVVELPKPSPSASAGGKASPSSTPAAPPPGAEVAFSFTGPVNARSIKFVYDSQLTAYVRFHGETPHKSEAGPQLAAVNVVILKVGVTEGTIRDAAGNLSPEISVTGSGEAIILRGGVAVTGKWARRSLSDKTTLAGPDGKPVQLLRGNTWVELLPKAQQVVVK